jgi:putative NADH-flavin reductase
MKIVVIGATGNIGSRIVEEALSRGHDVTGVVRDPSAVEAPDSRVRLVKGDATKSEDVARVVKGADAVVSAISPRPNPRGLPAPSLAANARVLIKGLREAGVMRVLYVGGASTSKSRLGRRSPICPISRRSIRPRCRRDATRWGYGVAKPKVWTGPT